MLREGWSRVTPLVVVLGLIEMFGMLESIDALSKTQRENKGSRKILCVPKRTGRRDDTNDSHPADELILFDAPLRLLTAGGDVLRQHLVLGAATRRAAQEVDRLGQLIETLVPKDVQYLIERI
jgi:hypothetical protein